MKYCTKCGAENNDADNFCSSCGANLIEQAAQAERENVERIHTSEIYEEEHATPWATFSIVGFVLGIVSLVFCWIPFSNIYFGGTGLVFSSMGKWSKTNSDKAKLGFTLSLIATIANFVITIIILVAGGRGLGNLFEEFADWISDYM